MACLALRAIVCILTVVDMPVAQAADVLNITREYLRRMIREGKAKAEKRESPAGVYWVLTEAEVERLAALRAKREQVA